MQNIEGRNDAVVPVSNVREFVSSNWNEGVRDIWNEEIIRAVNWFYGLDIGRAAVGGVERGIVTIVDSVNALKK